MPLLSNSSSSTNTQIGKITCAYLDNRFAFQPISSLFLSIYLSTHLSNYESLTSIKVCWFLSSCCPSTPPYIRSSLLKTYGVDVLYISASGLPSLSLLVWTILILAKEVWRFLCFALRKVERQRTIQQNVRIQISANAYREVSPMPHWSLGGQ